MDSSVSQLDLEQLNEKDKAELRQFVGNENQRTRVRERKNAFLLFQITRPKYIPLTRSFSPCCRNTRPHRHLLEEVRHGLGEERGAGQGRAELPGELRRPVPRRQLHDAQAPEQYAPGITGMGGRAETRAPRGLRRTGGRDGGYTHLSEARCRWLGPRRLSVGGAHVRLRSLVKYGIGRNMHRRYGHIWHQVTLHTAWSIEYMERVWEERNGRFFFICRVINPKPRYLDAD